MRTAIVLACGVLLLASACAPKAVPVPTVSTPKFPDFIAPTIPADYAGTPVAVGEDRGWRFLQAGDLKNAERELSATLKAVPGFFPAQTALGYVELARSDAKAALQHFDRALQQEGAYAPALVGRGQELLAEHRDADALAAFEAATAADPSLTAVQRRVDVLKFRQQEQSLAAARQAARAGKTDEAIRAYTHALATSPDSPFLDRELAAVERQKGDMDAALEHFRKAVELDGSDAASLEQIGDILDARGDYAGAAAAYGDANAIEPSDALTRKVEAMRDTLALASLPEEYRAIDAAPEITRADLAALIGVRLAPLLAESTREAVLITDVRANWASGWIMAVAKAGVMEPFANHAFQPRATVRRSDLAQAVAHLLSKIAARNPAQAKLWDGAKGRFADVSPGHLAYPAASAAVAAGVMKVGPDNAFQPFRAVTGAEAVAAIGRLQTLAGLTSMTGIGVR
jgi:tetratricopeptide (TPR) repeat protein